MLEQYDKQKIAGCLGFGCLLTVVLFALGGFGAYFGVKTLINSAVYKYTEPVRRPLPTVQMAPVEALELTERIDEFADSISNEEVEEVAPLELTATELNYIISTSDDPALQELRENVFFEFEDGKIKTELSIPLDRSGLKDLQGRYLNGSAELSVGANTGGGFEIDLRRIDANGFTIPDAALQAIQQQTDYIDKVLNHPRFTKYSKYLEAFEVNGDKLSLKLKKGQTLEELRRELASENITF